MPKPTWNQWPETWGLLFFPLRSEEIAQWTKDLREGPHGFPTLTEGDVCEAIRGLSESFDGGTTPKYRHLRNAIKRTHATRREMFLNVRCWHCDNDGWIRVPGWVQTDTGRISQLGVTKPPDPLPIRFEELQFPCHCQRGQKILRQELKRRPPGEAERLRNISGAANAWVRNLPDEVSDPTSRKYNRRLRQPKFHVDWEKYYENQPVDTTMPEQLVGKVARALRIKEE